MTDQTRAASGKSSGNFWVIAPFVIAVVGTVVMLFTNSANALKISLIFALWAAAAGIMVIDRTRRDRDRALEATAAREAELAEARRELSERPVIEVPGAAPAPAAAPASPVSPVSPVSPMTAVDVELLRELQEEIKALRAQLEEMRGEVFEYEPAAVRASARRIHEIEQTPEPAPAPRVEPAPFAGPSVSRRVRPAGAPSPDAVAGRIGQQPTREQPNPLSEIISEHAQRQEPKPEPAKPEPAKPEPAKPEQPQAPQERRGGRRRRDEHAESLSVAELLARSRGEQ